jgi:hypothetical protein
MRPDPIFRIILILFISGCGTDKTRIRDLDDPLISALKDYGAKGPIIRPIPTLRCKWSYSHDPDGFQFHIYGDSFSELNEWFRTTYGPPTHSFQKEESRHPLNVYNAAILGMAVQYGYDASVDQTFIIAVKPDALRLLGLTPSNHPK